MTRLELLRCGRLLCALAALICFVGIVTPAQAQFETFATQKLPNETLGIVTGDFNHDGKIDVATVGDYLSIFLGNGDGTFHPAVNYTALGYWIAVADFNKDGNLDLVTANGDNSVSVFLGNGDGTFQSPKISHTTNNCSFVAVGDFNGDHKMDLVVLNSGISILLGNGDGTFQAPIDNNSFPGGASWVAVGDFNNDHRTDVVAVGNYYGILLGNGDGTLQNATYSSFPFSIWSVATGDFNRDGNLDMAIGEYQTGGVFVFLGNGDGTFQQWADYSAGQGDGVLVQDFNHDGILDIVMGTGLLAGNGDGTFRLVGGIPTPAAGLSGGLEAAGDLNGDSLPDLVYIDNVAGVITTLLNTGVAIFYPSTPITFATQLVGTTSAPLTATITNSGSSPLTVSSVNSSGPPFHTRTTCQGKIAPGANCSIMATFSPKTIVPTSGTITIHDSASSKPEFIDLVGTGTVVKVVPRGVSFDRQKSGTHSHSKKVVVTNTGSTPLDFQGSIGIGGEDYFNFFESNDCPTALPAGASCLVHVIFAPRHSGLLIASLFIGASGGGGVQTVPLSGIGD